MKTTYKLTDEEKNIENEIETYTSVNKEKMSKIKRIIDATKKNRAISLRITNYDLEKLKEKADKEGIPYQTLITNVLHKYITNQYYEKEEVLKSIMLLKEKKAI